MLVKMTQMYQVFRKVLLKRYGEEVDAEDRPPPLMSDEDEEEREFLETGSTAQRKRDEAAQQKSLDEMAVEEKEWLNARLGKWGKETLRVLSRTEAIGKGLRIARRSRGALDWLFYSLQKRREVSVSKHGSLFVRHSMLGSRSSLSPLPHPSIRPAGLRRRSPKS